MDIVSHQTNVDKFRILFPCSFFAVSVNVAVTTAVAFTILASPLICSVARAGAIVDFILSTFSFFAPAAQQSKGTSAEMALGSSLSEVAAILTGIYLYVATTTRCSVESCSKESDQNLITYCKH